MRLQVFSDLHIDAYPVEGLAIGRNIDVVVVAGDTCEGADNAFAALRNLIPVETPIVMVMGNHEYYRRSIVDEGAKAKQLAPSYRIHLLDNAMIELHGVRFIGATLWTDYRLFGDHVMPLAMRSARDGLNDHRRIKWSRNPWRRFRPEEAQSLHRRSRAYLEAQLANLYVGPTIVVTHHAPHPDSVPGLYRHDLLSGAYASDLTGVIQAARPALWIHGHIHSSADYCAE